MSKVGIDSFLLDCHTNDNLAEIEAAFGIKGFAVVIRIWQKIYSEKGYYCEWSERSPLLFLAKWFGGNSEVDLKLINDVVLTALGNGIFDKKLYDEYSILTSEGIQNRYFDVVKRRNEVEVIEEYLLINLENHNVYKKSISVDKNIENDDGNYTSKVKESKEKKSNKYTCAFDEFWAVYPRKKDKGNAFKKFNARLNNGFSEEELIGAAKNYAAECQKNQTEEKYIKHPATFLSDSLPFQEYLEKGIPKFVEIIIEEDEEEVGDDW